MLEAEAIYSYHLHSRWFIHAKAYKKICGAQNAPHIGLSFIQICLHQHDLTKSLNLKINQEGHILSEQYGNEWKSQFQDTDDYTTTEESAIHQALTNIILNACEHGHSPQSIHLTFIVSNGKAEYKITNSGSHFSDAALVHATDKGFSEKKNYTQNIKGVGLYFTARAIRENGGELYLSNTPEGYACVQVIIPVVKKAKASNSI